MPDRELTREETLKFIKEGTEGKLGFNALLAFSRENTRPTLHDLCIIELTAIAEGQKQIIIEQGRAIEALKAEYKAIGNAMTGH
jgi:hypothetical protein